MSLMPACEAHVLDVAGATITYDVRGQSRHPAARDRLLMLIGSPMGAHAFGPLATQFDDRLVVTYDPRGVSRSVRTDGATQSTPDEHAEDLHRVIEVLDVGAVDMFATSGGAINALVLVARYPGDVHTLIAHEPPAAQVLADRDRVLAATEDVFRTYLRHGYGLAMAKFLTLAGRRGTLPAGHADEPAPDPSTFGLPLEDDGIRDHPLLAQNMPTSVPYEHDFAAIAAAPTRVLFAVGRESEGTLAARGAIGCAQRLNADMIDLPGDHVGFTKFSRFSDPTAFGAALRTVL